MKMQGKKVLNSSKNIYHRKNCESLSIEKIYPFNVKIILKLFLIGNRDCKTVN